MKKDLNEKTKKHVFMAALCIIGMAALIGIVCSLHKEEIPEKVTASGTPQMEEDVMAEWTAQVDEAVAPNTAEQEPAVTPTAEPELIVATDLGTPTPEDAGLEQKNQADPVKEDTEKPSEPPAEIKEQQEQKPVAKPENTIIPDANPTAAPVQENDPQHGQIKDGKIYIEGFGWIDYHGGGTVGMPADDMYENGNKVGSMD